MNKLRFLIVITFFVLGFSAYAFAVGYDSPISWAGNGVRVVYKYQDENNEEQIRIVNENIGTYGIGVTSYKREFYSPPEDEDEQEWNLAGYIYASASSSYYDIRGYIKHGIMEEYSENLQAYGDQGNYSVSPYDFWNIEEWWTGGYFRDEIYLDTRNGGPANVELVFQVHFNMSGIDGNDPSFVVAGEWRTQDGGFGGNLEGIQTWRGNHAETYQDVILTVENMESDKYLPISIGAWAHVYKSSLEQSGSLVNFGNTVELKELRIVQDGEILPTTEYTLISLNDGFEGNQMAPVPLPGTVMLLGSGLLGLAQVRKMKALRFSQNNKTP